MEENTIIKDMAETMYVQHPKSSYGIFCFNSQGDLFLNSDWGFFGYAWRSFGTDFKEFLAGTNSDYIVGKFVINYNIQTKSKMSADRFNHLKNLVSIFINELNQDLKK